MSLAEPAERSARTLGGLLAVAATQLGLTVPAAQSEQLLGFISLLERWNRTYNLTAIRDPEAMLTQHVVDCLAAVAPLRRECAPYPAPRLLDVGSGGGLPGIVFAVMLPGARVTCVDSVGKKAAFVRQAAAALRLANLEARHSRVESLRGERYDVVVARAFASLASFADLTQHLLAERGVWLAMKGRRPDAEIAELPATIEVFHVEPLDVPGLAAQRSLVWMRNVAGTPPEAADGESV